MEGRLSDMSLADETYQATRRVVLRDFPAREQIADFAERHDGREVGSEWLDEAQEWQHKTVWRFGSGVELWCVDDNVAGCCFVQTAGQDMTAVSELLHLAERELDVWTREELVEQVEEANDPRELGTALLLLGVSAPIGYDEEVAEVISGELYSEYEEVRDMAVWATSYSPYKEYRPDLEEVMANDESERVRTRARTVLRVFDELGIGEEI